jgi:hypothetical protein
VIASSSTVLSNLAYLIGAVVVAVILGLLVWLRHRAPKSVDANMASFRRGLSVLAPDPRSSGRPMPSNSASRTRPAPALTHVRLEPAPRPAHFRAGGSSGDNGRPQSGEDHSATEEAGGDGLGAESG